MSTPDPVTPAAIPWYQSTMLRGLVVILVSQAVARVQSQFHLDVPGALGLTVNDLVNAAMDALALFGAGLVVHGRVTQKAAPVITATRTGAAKINLTKGA